MPTETDPHPFVVLHICADNDTNGNPRRCYAVLLQTGATHAVVDEGYEGNAAWRRALPNDYRPEDAAVVRVNVSPKEYRRWLKVGDAINEGRRAVVAE